MNTPASNTYLDDIRRLDARLAGDGLESIRQNGAAGFLSRGFPGLRDENWKYTDVRPIARNNFTLAAGGNGQIPSATMAGASLAGEGCHELVFINGRFAAEFSTTGKLPGGVIIVNLADAVTRHQALVHRHLSRYADTSGNAFTALNTACIEHGCLIHIPDNITLEVPVHLLFISGMQVQPFASHPRTMIILGDHARASVIESYYGVDEGAYFTNTVTEAWVQPGSVLQHYKIQNEGRGGYHVGNLAVRQEQDSLVESHSLSLGGALVRNDISVQLNAEGAAVRLHGLYLAGERQHVDHHTRIDHLVPRTRSQENYRGVLDGQARGVFNGKVIVHAGAQGTEAAQSNANLLLSDGAEVDTKPELEIYADDVKCSHGATVGQLDENMLFYLRARAIDDATARSILTFAFAEEILKQISLTPLRQRLEQMVIERLPDAALIREFAA